MKKKIFLLLSLAIYVLMFTACKKRVHEKRTMSKLSKDSTIIFYGTQLPSLPLEVSNINVINIPDNPEFVNADSIISHCDYIPLETMNEFLIGEIYKIDFDSSYIFIFDRDNSNLFQFYKDGKFSRRIGIKGNGPNEYIELQDFALDKKNKEISLLDIRTKKILHFDYSGKFIRKESMYYNFYNMEFYNDKMITYTGTAYNKNTEIVQFRKIIISERNQKPLYGNFPFTEKYRNNVIYSIFRPLKNMNDKIYYSNFMCDTIWSISDSTCQAEIILRMKDSNFLTQEKLSNIDKELFNNLRKSKRNFYGDFLITKNYSIFMIDKSGIVNPLIYSNKTNQLYYGNISHKKMQKNINHILGYHFDFIYNDSCFIQILQPYLFKRYIADCKGLVFDKESLDFINSIKEEDNPILKIITLKEF